MRIPGWRAMAPAEVGARIEAVLRAGGRDPVEIATVRRPPAPLAGVGVAAMPVVAVSSFIAVRSRLERVSWLLWVAGLALVVGARRRWTSRSEQPAP
jgi:hypothetical protein